MRTTPWRGAIQRSQQHPDAHGFRPETPEQAAKRLVERWGRVVAAETAVKRMRQHAPRKPRRSDLEDDDRLAAKRYQEATRSIESYDHWRAVASWIARHLTNDERKQLGMKPREKTPP